MKAVFVLIMVAMLNVFSGCAYISGMREDSKLENKINTQAGAEAEKRNSAPDEQPKTTAPAATSANDKSAANANQAAAEQENTILTAIQRKALRALTMPLVNPQENVQNTQSPTQPTAATTTPSVGTQPAASGSPNAGAQPVAAPASPSAEAKPGSLWREKILSRIQSLSKLLDAAM